MAKKKAELPPAPLKSGEKVYRFDAPDQVWIITSINHEAAVADIVLKDTELEWFKYPISKLKRIAPQNSDNKAR